MAEGLFGGRLKLGDEIGRGAMGVVYKAVRDDQIVAVKVLHPHLTSDLAVVGRFVREHQALSRIKHPNVIRVIELLVDDPRLGIVMEYLDCPDLGKLIASSEIDPARAVRLAAGIAAGVAATHEARVAHRDLKPANVMVASAIDVTNGAAGGLPDSSATDGFGSAVSGASVIDVPKIADFGVSRLIGQSMASATTTLGTPLYMSPEATGGSNPIGQPSDIYSLGIMLFEMLTGRPPYQAEEPIAIAVAHVNSPVPVVGGVPDQLTDLLQAMLAKDPDDRPAAVEVADQLAVLAPHIPATLTPLILNEADLQVTVPSRSVSWAAETMMAGGPGEAPLWAGSPGDEAVAAAGTAGETIARAPLTTGPDALVDPDQLPPSPLTSPLPGSAEWAPGVPPSHGNGQPARPPAIEPSGSVLDSTPGGSSPPFDPFPGPGRDPDRNDRPMPGHRRPMSMTTASSVDRSRNWLIVAAVLLAGLTAAAVFLYGRGADDGDVDLVSGNTAFSFMPRVATNGLITTRRWELGTDSRNRRIIDAEVIVANTGDEPITATHYEAFPKPVDADHLVESFDPQPDEVVDDPGVAVFEMGELAPRARFTLTYEMLAPDGVESVEELQALAESQGQVEVAYLESLPGPEAQEAMETEGVLTSLTLTPTSARVEVGEVIPTTLTGTLSDGSSVDPAALAGAVWEIENPDVAQLTADNSIRGLASGRTIVRVSVGEIEATMSLRVSAAEVAAGSSTTTRSATSSTSASTTSSTAVSTTSTTDATSSTASTTSSVGSSTSASTTSTTEATTTTPSTAGTTASTTSTSASTTSTTEATEPALTMSQLSVQVNPNNGSFKIGFTTNLCTIANYQGAGQSYITPGWPEVTGPCWQSHGQNFTPVEPGTYTITVRARSEGGQQKQRVATVEIP